MNYTKEDFNPLARYLHAFFGPHSSDTFGYTYPEIVKNTMADLRCGEDLADEVDRFLAQYPDEQSAQRKLDELTGEPGFSLRFPPTLIVFLTWLSSCLKELNDK